MADLDVQGVSYYPYWDKAASTLSNFKETVENMASAYNKPIVVVETDWPTECTEHSSVMPAALSDEIPFSSEGQVTWVKDVAGVLTGLSVETGLMYWEPAWVDNAKLGSSCESAIMVTPSWSGNTGTGKALSYVYSLLSGEALRLLMLLDRSMSSRIFKQI